MNYLEAPVLVAAITGAFGLLTTIVTVVLQVRLRSSMKTNHGSRNIGDAIDKLTEKTIRIEEKQLENRERLVLISAKVTDYVEANEEVLRWSHHKMREEQHGEAE